MIEGPGATGGVITSAGRPVGHVLHAAGPRSSRACFHVGFTVALGLLVDTFVIRIFLVPSIVLKLRTKAL